MASDKFVNFGSGRNVLNTDSYMSLSKLLKATVHAINILFDWYPY